MKLRILSKLILFLVVISCSSQETPTGKTQAEVLYKEAKQLMDDGRYIMATEKLNQIKSQFPYSYYSTHSELLLADVLYLQESYVEASAAYIVFRDFHPKYKELDYVIYKIAEAFYKQVPDTFDRDLTSASEAIRYFDELLLKYPGTKHEEEAKKKMGHAKKMIRNKEKYIADFYFKTKVYSAARYRYLKILREFNEKSLMQHSMSRVIQASYKLGKMDECGTYVKKYFDLLGGPSKIKIKKIVTKCLKN
jgi:outer membrane protein assembly factor BamD